MGRLRATSLILAPLLAALALVACGSGSDAKLLPAPTASEINQNLEAVRQRVGEGNCEGAEEAAAAVSTEVDELGSGVDKKLRAALSEGAERLGKVVVRCAEAEEEKLAEAEQEDLEEAEEEEQAGIEAEEQSQEKEEKLQEKEEKTQFREEEKQEKEEEKAEGQAGKEGPPGQEEGTIEPVEPPTEGPVEEGPAGGIGPGEGVE
jgi:chemotaxis protein histidine kinase CheA